MYVIRLFAGLAERIGTHEVTLSLPSSSTIGDIRSALAKQFPEVAQELTSALAAVNQRYAANDAAARWSDEIAWIPPVGGGAPSCRSVRLTAKALEVTEAYRTLEDARNGGTVLFVGTVREWTGNRRTTHLAYEAYEAMALQQMERIAEEIEAEYPGVATVQWHRVGELQPTDIAVICAAASPHRDNAFLAARKLIERLKKEVPIWKKEYYVDGDVVWQANPE